MTANKVFEIARMCTYDHEDCDNCPYEAVSCRDGLIASLLSIAERLMNCANCNHRHVCHTVIERKATRANDYTPCGHWTMEEDDK